LGISDDDVREILRIVDESQLDELRIEVEGLSLHVRRGGAQPRASAPASAPSNGATNIDAPMLGTFYRAEGPGERPFVEVGDRVEPDTVVCLIEVMKLMNHIQAGVSGEVVEVLAENAQLVEYGQPLFRVAP
jgi:acetyl-CoA carboxylase biotin carboxyl carrier protein